MKNQKQVPFFAKFLEKQVKEDSDLKGGKENKITKPALDTFQTMKYPSDADEAMTMKYPSDSDEA
ncbi:MAG: microviridin/marinostatin family tricyclic proteinase inhibitor [Crocinitomix sp.]|nr:microviridin/marinostatin family tricyclic proteinase inhibitor [Crocinitomix sp.]